MKRNMITKTFVAAPVALIALAAMPDQAQAGHYVSSYTYVTTTPTYTYVPTSTVYYYADPAPCHSNVYYSTYPTFNTYPSTVRTYSYSVNTLRRPISTPRIRTFRSSTFSRTTRIIH
jgi:hypothetical protein